MPFRRSVYGFQLDQVFGKRYLTFRGGFEPAGWLLHCRLPSDDTLAMVFGMKMDCETESFSADQGGYQLVCEQCGSLTIALPLEILPSPDSQLKCGRCGAPRGTLQSLRDRSNRVGY